MMATIKLCRTNVWMSPLPVTPTLCATHGIAYFGQILRVLWHFSSFSKGSSLRVHDKCDKCQRCEIHLVDQMKVMQKP